MNNKKTPNKFIIKGYSYTVLVKKGVIKRIKITLFFLAPRLKKKNIFFFYQGL